MIARYEPSAAAGLLALGDEPADLARGRLLFDLERAAGREPTLAFAAKGEVPGETALGGESAEWLLHERRAAIPAGREWLLELAAAAETGEGSAALKDVAVLLSSARRSAAHDLPYAFRALGSPPEIVRRDPRLAAFREECRLALGGALRARPRFGWRLAIVTFESAEALEDIVAARWRDKFRDRVVLAANLVYAEDRVVYAFRGTGIPDPRAVLLSALPEGSPAPRTDRDGLSGRGSISAEGFAELLARLRIRDPTESPR